MRRSIWYLLLASAAVLLILRFVLPSPTESLSYSDFRRAIAKGDVVAVQLGAQELVVTLRAEGAKNADRRVLRVEDPELVRDLLDASVTVSAQPESKGWDMLVSWLPWLALIGGSLLLSRGVTSGLQRGLPFGQSKVKMYIESEVKVRFSDVAGVDEAKQELTEVIEFLTKPDKFRRLGGKLPKGILLVGPPGTGKTLLARAVAGEAKVPFFSISGSEFVELFVGVGAARVRDLFVQAKAKAPCIIFIDELDALGKARGLGPMAHEEREQTLNQLLVELDGFDPRERVVLMAATNRPEILDPALLRAGRFDRHVLVDRPDKTGRLAILRVHTRDVALAANADLDALAAITVGMVGADLANIVNEAALLAVRRGHDAVEQADLEEAIERVVAGLEKKNRMLNRMERERVAHHEVGHAFAALLLSGADEVQKISIIPRGVSALGYTLQRPIEDRFLMTKAELETKIAVLLGGRAAEELVFSDTSTGAQDDLAKATDIAKSMVKSFGMSAALGHRSFSAHTRPLFVELADYEPPADYSQRLAAQIDDEVRDILDAQYLRVREALGARLAALRTAAATLLEKETLGGEDLKRFLAQSQGKAAVLVTRLSPGVASS